MNDIRQESDIELNITGIITRGELLQLINKETSCWAFIDKRYLDLVKLMQRGIISFSQICNEISIPKENIKEKIKYFFESGILRIENKSELTFSSLYAEPCFKPYFALINITDQCNYRCSYCYYSSKNKCNMPLSLIIKIINDINSFEATDNMEKHICFHGGEPLLFFNEIRNAWEDIRKKPHSHLLNFSIQTNGSLLTEEMALFFKDADFNIGVSIDGPETLHNSFRKYYNNLPSFSDTMRGIEILKKYNIKFGTLTTLTKKNIYKTDNIIDFFISNEIYHTAMTPVFFVDNCNIYNYNEFKISYNDLLQARKNIYKKINKIKNKIKFCERELSSLLTNIFTVNRAYMCGKNPCGAGYDILSFEPNGDIYPCDNLTNVKEFKIGNICCNDLKEIENNLILMRKPKSIDEIEMCNQCHYKHICKGYCVGHNISDRYSGFNKEFCEFSYGLIDFFMDEISNNRLDMEYFL